MFNVSTATKMKVARAASFVVRTVRGSKNSRVVCKRNHLHWDLDLLEGIDLSIYLFGSFEVQTSRFLERSIQPGFTVFDIGANIGAHALPMSACVGTTGRVIAVEPTDWAFSKMVRNRSLNPQLEKTLIPVQAALGDGKQELPEGFFSSWSLDEKKDAHPVHGGVSHAASKAERLTLDQLAERFECSRVDLIKMDVDGFELQVLRGGAGVLKRFHPKLVMEVCPHVFREYGTSVAELLEVLKDVGYRKISALNGHALPFDAAALEKGIPEGGSINVLFTS